MSVSREVQLTLLWFIRGGERWGNGSRMTNVSSCSRAAEQSRTESDLGGCAQAGAFRIDFK